jgi:hypothetical protein
MLENGSCQHAIKTGGSEWKAGSVCPNARSLQHQVASYNAVKATRAAAQVEDVMCTWAPLLEHGSQEMAGI